ncbi:MAG: ZIP family metal transporter [Solirubrobacteraceae bacterium]|nr:MAG: zinc permease [Solirubrobacterales bacterium]
MSFLQTVALGALAGLTIYVGLPLARLRVLGTRARVGLAMFSVGILAFIFVDVMSHAHDLVASAVTGFRAGHHGLGHVIVTVSLLAAGFGAGCAGLGAIERRLRPTAPQRPPIAGADALSEIPGAYIDALAIEADEARARALRVSLTIAVAIGLHNFAEGLAIGVSAKAGAISLATVLIIGFALHNATEGFGIVGPLGDVRPSWRWLAVIGLIAGGPTFVGSVVGYNVTSAPLELAFYSLAGGAILYVVGEIWQGMRRYGHRELGLAMLAVGFLAGVATDLIVTYGGG